MAGVRKYTEEDRAKVYFSLQINEGNVKRSARETGYPESTVRMWKKEFSEKGPPSSEVLDIVSSDFVADADRVRNKALMRIEKMIDDTDANVKLAELNTTVGILTDKLDRARGLDIKRVEHEHHLPSAEEARELFRGFAEEMFSASAARDAEIDNSDIVEQKALPAAP